MKKAKIALFISSFFIAFAGFSSLLNNVKSQPALADETDLYPRSGTSGTLMYVNGQGTYFKDNEAKLAICCWNSGGSAWSEFYTYRCFGDMIRVMIPYKNGQSQTWSNFKICRYNPSMNPQTDGDSGVYNETDTISFGSLMYAQNTFLITGYNNSKLTYSVTTSKYYGIKAENHMYLDLSGFTEWEDLNAKFAIWFSAPNSNNESRWSLGNSEGGYYSSFCWKVNGQDNDHLYECIVPNIYSGDSRNLWNMVIAVRFNPEASEPNWDYKWNQTQNLSFNSSNHNANMIRISGWTDGYLDADNVISNESRLDFYGRYFNANVVCSDDGNSDATTSTMWSTVKNEYKNHLSRFAQGDVWKTIGNEDGNEIAKAMARYDYIVFYKQYNHEDFINRKDSPNLTQYSVSKLNNESGDIVSLIAIVVGVSLLSVTLVVVISIKKSKNKQK